MAGEWIKIRRGLRQHPKTIAMARHLAEDRSFIDWWSNPVQYGCRHSVTEIVTFANVTRVTVCALTEFWGVLNEVIGDDCRVPCMTIADIDEMVEIPGFGEALLSVGWVVEDDENGLFFPNFLEHNVPRKSRHEPKTPAQRSKEYRERKKQSDARHARHETSHREEKRREEKNLEITPTPTPIRAPAQEQQISSSSSSSSSSDFASDDPRECWGAFRARWKAEKRAAPLGTLENAIDPPRAYLDLWRGGDSKAALDALGQLSECRYFEKPLSLAQFLNVWPKIAVGGYREPRGSAKKPDDKPTPERWLDKYQPAEYKRPREAMRSLSSDLAESLAVGENR